MLVVPRKNPDPTLYFSRLRRGVLSSLVALKAISGWDTGRGIRSLSGGRTCDVWKSPLIETSSTCTMLVRCSSILGTSNSQYATGGPFLPCAVRTRSLDLSGEISFHLTLAWPTGVQGVAIVVQVLRHHLRYNWRYELSHRLPYPCFSSRFSWVQAYFAQSTHYTRRDPTETDAPHLRRNPKSSSLFLKHLKELSKNPKSRQPRRHKQGLVVAMHIWDCGSKGTHIPCTAT